MSRPLFLLLLAAAAAAGAWCVPRSAADAGDAQKPMPVDRSQILKEGVYYVQGRVRIPKGVDITLQKGSKIVGRDGVGVIELEGELRISGIRGTPVALENITIELQPAFVEVHLKTVEFRAKSGGIVTPKDKPGAGKVVLEDCRFETGAGTVDVALRTGSVEISDWSNVHQRVSVVGVDPPDVTGNSVKLVVEACNYYGGLEGGLYVENVSDVTVKTSEIAGESMCLVGCGATLIDGDYLRCKKVELGYGAGGFAKVKFQRCDVQCQKIVLTAPPAVSIPQTCTIDNCWFDGETTARMARQRFVDDRDTTPASGVVASLTRVAPRPLGFGGTPKR